MKTSCKVPFAVENFSALSDDTGLRPRDAAIILGIGLSTFWAWAAKGRLRVRRIGRTTRTSAGEVRRLLEESRAS